MKKYAMLDSVGGFKEFIESDVDIITEKHVFRLKMDKETGKDISERIFDSEIIEHILNVKTKKLPSSTNNTMSVENVKTKKLPSSTNNTMSVDFDETPCYTIREFDPIHQLYIMEVIEL